MYQTTYQNSGRGFSENELIDLINLNLEHENETKLKSKHSPYPRTFPQLPNGQTFQVENGISKLNVSLGETEDRFDKVGVVET